MKLFDRPAVSAAPFRKSRQGLLAAAALTTVMLFSTGGPSAAQETTGNPATVESDFLPLSGPALLLLRNAELALTDGNPKKAISDLDEAIRQRPDSEKLRATLIEALRADGRYADARTTALEAADDSRIPPDGRKRLAAMAVGGNDNVADAQPDAASSADDRLSDTGNPLSESNPAYQAASAAYRAYDDGDYRSAVEEAEKALTLFPDNSDYKQLLANARAALKMSAAKPAAQSPAAVAANSAYAALRNNNLPQALRYSENAVRSAPANLSYQLLLIDVLNRSGAHQQALNAVNRAIGRFGPDRTLLSQSGVLKQELGDQQGAKADFERALTMPGTAASEKQLRLNLAAAAMAVNAPEDAYQALAPLGDTDDASVWLMRGKALTGLKAYTAAATALQQAGKLAGSNQQRADVTVASLDLIAAQNGNRSARSALNTAETSGALSTLSATETAYLAARLGDRSLAYNAFDEAYQNGQLSGGQFIDAAYAARRDYKNDEAIFWLKRAIDEADAGTLSLSPQELYGLRREVSDIIRQWGANIGLFYGSSGIGNGYLTPPAAAGRNMQLGSEFFWRPKAFGYRDGRTVDFFIRQFTTLYDSLDGAVGASTMQGAFGVRVKPFTNINLTLEAARYFKIGRNSRNDFLLRAATSGGFNGDLMPWKDQWWTGQYYGEVGRYFESDENYALANANLGRSFRLGGDGGRLVVTPFIGISADFDNTYATEFALGAGPGINFRYWFRESKYQAPMSHLDFGLQYRARIGGDDRARGWFATLNLAL